MIIATAAPFAITQADPRAEAAQLEREGRTAEAEAIWQAFAAKHPADAEAFAHIGQLAARQEHYADAIAAYKKAMAIAPAMPGLRPNLGLVYFKSGNLSEAITIFEPMAKANPTDERIALLVGMSHYGLQEYKAATPFLKVAADTDSANLNLQMTLAHACLFARDFACVLNAFHRVIAIKPDSAEAHMMAGEALDEMKDPIGAQKELRAAIAADPKQPEVHFGLGYLLWTKAQYPEAEHEFQAELANNPEHLLSKLYLGDIAMKNGKPDEAQPLLETVAKTAPENVLAHRDLGNLYSDKGQNEAAVAELKEAIRLAPKDSASHWKLGQLYRKLGKPAEARAEFEQTNKLNEAEDDHLLNVMKKLSATDAPAPKQ